MPDAIIIAPKAGSSRIICITHLQVLATAHLLPISVDIIYFGIAAWEAPSVNDGSNNW